MKRWVEPFGRPLQVRSDPEGAYKSRELSDRAASHSILWDPEPAEAHWKIGKVEVAIRLTKEAATRMAFLDPQCPIEELFIWATTAHNEMHNSSGHSPDDIILGRRKRPLDSELLGDVIQIEQETISGSPAEAAMMRRSYARQGYAAAQADRQLRVSQLRATRSHAVYECGQLVLVWRRTKGKRRDPKGDTLDRRLS